MFVVEHLLVLQVEGPHADPQLHRKHLRTENQDLREQVPQNAFFSQHLLYSTCFMCSPVHSLSSPVVG